MAKAAERLAVSRPVVSKVIAGLETLLGVRLLDRVSDGVQPTAYGHALVRHGRVVFDALRQGAEEVAFLSDPGTSTLRIGCTEVGAAGIVAAALDRLALSYPRARFEVEQGSVASILRLLRERRADIVVTRIVGDDPDIAHETLVTEQLLVVCGTGSRWARQRRPLTLATLADAPWIQSPPEIAPGGPTYLAFASLGLPIPAVRVVTNSLNLRYGLLEGGHFLTMIPHSVLILGAQRARLRVLPVPALRWRFPTVVATLKGRTIPPLASLFIEELRAVAASLAARPTFSR